MPTNDKKLPALIGCDPEFNITTQGAMIDAKSIISKYKENETNCDKYGFVNVDGHQSIGELNPQPTNSPHQLTENIRKLIKKFINRMSYDNVPLIDLTTISQWWPIGGHIHIDTPFNLYKEGIDGLTEPTTVNDIYYDLTNYSTLFSLPVLMSEDKYSALVRHENGNYGKMDGRNNESFRIHDEINYVIELRIPSAEWLTTPAICEATLAYYGVVYNGIFDFLQSKDSSSQTLKQLSEKGLLTRKKTELETIQNAMDNNMDIVIKPFMKQIRKIVREFPLYKKFKDEIEYILHPQQIIKDKKKVQYSITKGWNMGGATNKKLFTNQKRSEYIIGDSLMDLEDMYSLINGDNNDNSTINANKNLIENIIMHNPDKNTSNFSKALTDAVITNNISLNNHYMIFGLRKTINEPIIGIVDNKDMPLNNSEIKTLIQTKQNQEADSIFNLNEDSIYLIRDILTHIGIKASVKIIKKYQDLLKKKNIILVGVPYEMRRKSLIRQFLGLIYDIETNKYPIVTVEKLCENINESPNTPQQETASNALQEESIKINNPIRTIANEDNRYESIKNRFTTSDNNTINVVEHHPTA